VLDIMLFDGSSEGNRIDDLAAALDDEMVNNGNRNTWEDEVSTV